MSDSKSELESSFEDMTRSYEESITALQSESDQQISGLNATVTSLRDEIDTLQTDKNDMTSKIGQLSHDLENEVFATKDTLDEVNKLKKQVSYVFCSV